MSWYDFLFFEAGCLYVRSNSVFSVIFDSVSASLHVLGGWLTGIAHGAPADQARRERDSCLRFCRNEAGSIPPLLLLQYGQKG